MKTGSLLNYTAILLITLSYCGCSTNLIDSAKTYERKGDYNTAVIYYEKAENQKLKPVEKAMLYVRLTRIYSSIGYLDTAEQWLGRLLQIIPDLPEGSLPLFMEKTDYQYCQALVALRVGNYKRCISILESVLKDIDIKELACDVKYYLVLAYIKQASGYTLEKSILATAELKPSSSDFSQSVTLINEGRNLVKPGFSGIEQAKIKFELALECLPGDNSTQINYEKALTMLKGKQYDKAINLLSEMSETPDVCYYISKAYREQAKTYGIWLKENKNMEIKDNVAKLYEGVLENTKADQE